MLATPSTLLGGTATDMSTTRVAWGKEEWETKHSAKGNPFDQEQPYEWIVALETEGKIRGKVLDLGCGAGHNAIYLASKGYDITGIDLSRTAVERAREKASSRGIAAKFVQASICEPLVYEGQFETVIDIGCFHSLLDEDHAKYAANLHRACAPGATIFLRAFSNFNGRQDVSLDGKIFQAPSVSKIQLRNAFSEGWTIASLEHKEFELSEIGLVDGERQMAKAWFAQIERDSKA